MNEIISKDDIVIENLIYEIRGKQVMLDSDLAKLYHCKNGTKEINQAVKRNLDKFPEDFCFKITEEELKRLSRSQFVTLNRSGNQRGYNMKYLPYVFTQEGVAMLATILRTEVAKKISIDIMRAFVAMRRYISNDLLEQKYINKQVLKNTEDIKRIQESFKKFEEKKKESDIYFNGQMFDAYFKVYKIFESAKTSLTIVDNYADNTILDLVKRLKVKVTIITKSNSLLTPQDIKKYNMQYHNLKVIYNNTFHDRYFIIDDKTFYHCGASVNRIGYKTFCINLMGDEEQSKALTNKIKKICD